MKFIAVERMVNTVKMSLESLTFEGLFLWQ